MHNLRIPLQHYTVGRILSVHRGELALEEDDRKSLLRQVRSGEFADSLEIEAITYLQEDKPNRNFLRFKPSILSKVAKSFIGVPFLKDHEHGKLEARGGTIVASKLEKDENGVPRFRQRIQLVKPWAIEGALDGTLDRFSISWHSDKRPVCSIDGDPILSGYYSRMDGECTHFPGDEVTNDETGDVQIRRH
jgi:hypothetical protein